MLSRCILYCLVHDFITVISSKSMVNDLAAAVWRKIIIILVTITDVFMRRGIEPIMNFVRNTLTACFRRPMDFGGSHQSACTLTADLRMQIMPTVALLLKNEEAVIPQSRYGAQQPSGKRSRLESRCWLPKADTETQITWYV